MTNTITERLREMTEKTGEENEWNFDDLVDDVEQFIQQELSSLFTKFEEEIIDTDLEDTTYWTTSWDQARINLRKEQRQKLAELKKEYMGGEVGK